MEGPQNLLLDDFSASNSTGYDDSRTLQGGQKYHLMNWTDYEHIEAILQKFDSVETDNDSRNTFYSKVEKSPTIQCWDNTDASRRECSSIKVGSSSAGIRARADYGASFVMPAKATLWYRFVTGENLETLDEQHRVKGVQAFAHNAGYSVSDWRRATYMLVNSKGGCDGRPELAETPTTKAEWDKLPTALLFSHPSKFTWKVASPPDSAYGLGQASMARSSECG